MPKREVFPARRSPPPAPRVGRGWRGTARIPVARVVGRVPSGSTPPHWPDPAKPRAARPQFGDQRDPRGALMRRRDRRRAVIGLDAAAGAWRRSTPYHSVAPRLRGVWLVLRVVSIRD